MDSNSDEALSERGVSPGTVREIIRRSMENAGQVAAYEGFWSPASLRAPFAAEPPGVRRPLTGLATGFQDVDALLGGLQPGQLTVLAGAGSSGLSTFVQNVARKVALRTDMPGASVALVSFEAAKEQIVRRLLCAEARVDPHTFSAGRFSGGAEWERLTRAADRLSQAALFIADDRELGLSDLRESCARLAASGKLSLVLVDPLESVALHRDGSREELSTILPALKEIAERFSVPVLATHTRETALGDPAAAGAALPAPVQLYADVIALLHRPDYWFPAGRSDRDYYEAQKGLEIVEFTVTYQKDGPSDSARLGFYTRLARFDDICWEPEDAPAAL